MGMFRLDFPAWVKTPVGSIDLLSVASVEHRQDIESKKSVIIFNMKYTYTAQQFREEDHIKDDFDEMVDTLRKNGFIPLQKGPTIEVQVSRS
jgi:hypothetical protein